jgi:hypothetical protein
MANMEKYAATVNGHLDTHFALLQEQTQRLAELVEAVTTETQEDEYFTRKVQGDPVTAPLPIFTVPPGHLFILNSIAFTLNAAATCKFLLSDGFPFLTPNGSLGQQQLNGLEICIYERESVLFSTSTGAPATVFVQGKVLSRKPRERAIEG